MSASAQVTSGASLEPPLHPFSTARRLAGEALGTALLLAIVIGSGIMGERLAAGNVAVALLGNTLSTGAGLVVLITVFGPISGAHFNPAVTLAFALRGELPARLAGAYVAAQTAGRRAGRARRPSHVR
jgi:glycerol uptake facilitator-like aquaporin